MRYPPLFRRIPVDEKTTGQHIQEIEEMYENFWSRVHYKITSNSEKTMAMRKMQESCQWLCRAVAIAEFAPTKSLNQAAPLNPVMSKSSDK